jgi:hypothetical protein
MTAALVVLVVGGLAVYTVFARAVGLSAQRKGRSFEAWSVIAFVFGLVLPAIVVACMRDDPVAARTEWDRISADADSYSRRPAGAGAGAGRAADAVRQLERLRVDGLLTDAEFEARKKHILDRL